MTTPRIPARLRRVVLARAAGRCAFCQCVEALMGVTFEIDHINPRSMGGETVLENLCVCCPMCNRHKATRTRVADPLTGTVTRLFHPERDAWDDHFAWREGASLVVGTTPVGRATVEALRMNRPQMVELRRYWVETGRHPHRLGEP